MLRVRHSTCTPRKKKEQEEAKKQAKKQKRINQPCQHKPQTSPPSHHKKEFLEHHHQRTRRFKLFQPWHRRWCGTTHHQGPGQQPIHVVGCTQRFDWFLPYPPGQMRREFFAGWKDRQTVTQQSCGTFQPVAAQGRFGPW